MAAPNCARYVGAEVALIDIEESDAEYDRSCDPHSEPTPSSRCIRRTPVELQRMGHRPRVVIEDAAHAPALVLLTVCR